MYRGGSTDNQIGQWRYPQGGSDALHSNLMLTGLIRSGLKNAGLPENCVAIVENTKRESVLQLVRLKDYIDVIIPRGGLELIVLLRKIRLSRSSVMTRASATRMWMNLPVPKWPGYLLQCQGTTSGSLQCHGNLVGTQ